MKILNIFLGVDMRMGHLGLANLAKSKSVNVYDLASQSGTVFISKDKQRMKVYAYNGVLSYIKSDNKARPLDLAAIDEFPKAFSRDGRMDYGKALKLRLEKALKTKKLDEGVL